MTNTSVPFLPTLHPAARVKAGEEIVFETHDCFHGQIRSESDLVTTLDWNRTNPATEPVYIEGAAPDTILRLAILDVQVEAHSVMVTIPGAGALGDRISTIETTILGREGDELVFEDKVRIPLAPMIGVIGIAPAHGPIGNAVSGTHGGNMDCTLIGKGSRPLSVLKTGSRSLSLKRTAIPYRYLASSLYCQSLAFSAFLLISGFGSNSSSGIPSLLIPLSSLYGSEERFSSAISGDARGEQGGQYMRLRASRSVIPLLSEPIRALLPAPSIAQGSLQISDLVPGSSEENIIREQFEMSNQCSHK